MLKRADRSSYDMVKRMKQIHLSRFTQLFKQLFFTAFLASFLSPLSLSAEEGSLSVPVNVESVQDMTEEASQNIPNHFMEASGSFDYISNAKFTKRGYTDQSITFALGGTGLRYVQFLGCSRQFAVTAAVDYFDNLLKWKENPYFSQDHFHNLAFSVGGMFQGETWLWKCNLGASFDLDAGKIGGYTLYSGQLWGRYSMTPNLGLHVGAIGITGLHENRAWPIFGFDYTWREKWKLRLIYPVDISLFYSFNCNWSLGVVHRLFWVRHRIQPRKNQIEGLERNSGAFVEYRNRGTEIALRYEYDPVFQVTVHAGYAHGGEVCLSEASCCDRVEFHRRRFKGYRSFCFDNSAYIGGQASLKF